MLRRMDRVVCVSHGQADKAKRAGVRSERIEVIHNAINTSRFTKPDPAYREKLLEGFPASVRSNIKFIIGAAGRLSPEKGFEILIEAAQAVSRKHPEVGFVLFGEGCCENRCSPRSIAPPSMTTFNWLAIPMNLISSCLALISSFNLHTQKAFRMSCWKQRRQGFRLLPPRLAELPKWYSQVTIVFC